jgi:hypothetical protein
LCLQSPSSEPVGTGVMPGSIYKSREGAAKIQALHDEALGGLGLRYESLAFRNGSTRSPSG